MAERSCFESSGDTLVGETRRAFLAQCSRTLRQLGPGEAEELHAKRCIENGTGRTQPVVERVFRPADRVWRPFRKPHGNIEGARLKLRVGYCNRNETDALGLLAADRLA